MLPQGPPQTQGNCRSGSDAGSVGIESGEEDDDDDDDDNNDEDLSLELFDLPGSAGVSLANHWDDVHLHSHTEDDGNTSHSHTQSVED